MGQRHGLDLVVRDVDRGDPERLLHMLELGPHVAAQLGVEIGQRLVHEKDRRSADDGTCQCDTLLLAAGQFPRVAIEKLVELHLRRGVANGASPSRLFPPSGP